MRAFHHSFNPSTTLVGPPHGALPLFAPTRAKLATRHTPAHGHAPPPFTWTARNHRKHRHVKLVPQTGRPRLPAHLANMAQLEFWNVSWWIAVLFALGSVVWVVNGFVVFLPYVAPVARNPAGAGWSAWVGATIFEGASVLLILEAWNRNNVAGFGEAVVQLAEKGVNTHKVEQAGNSGETLATQQHWVWWSADRKFWHELGFVAGFTQFTAASVFWISGFTAIPQLLDELAKHPAALRGIYWTPQVVGGCGFIISSTLYMFETQKKWYRPALTSLGWHIAFWNFIGAIGFTLSGALGYATSSGALYQSALSTFWGGWAFLIGSVMQWYEAVNPVRMPA